MKLSFFLALLCYIAAISAEETRLLDLEPTDAQQIIESQDQTLKYAPKIESNAPAVRFLGNEPHHVLEDVYLARQYHGQDGLGGYLYGYSVPDIAKNEKKKPSGDLKGAYQYVNGQGQEIKVEYWDDGNGFHQIDNVPKILPKQIDDSPEVKAAKDQFLKRWHEEAERNQHPVQSPYNNEGQYASGPLSAQGQLERKQQFAQQYPQQGQYQPQGTQQYGSQAGYQPGQYQVGQQQGGQSGQYQGGQASGQYQGGQTSGQYQGGQSGQYQGGQASGQYQGGQSGQYQGGQPSGQYQGGQSGQYQGGQPSGQYQGGHQTGQYKPVGLHQPQGQQYGGQPQQQSGSSSGYHQGGQQSFGQNQPAYGQSQQHFGQNQPIYAQSQQGNIKTSYSSAQQNQIDYSGQGSESRDTYAKPQQGKQNEEEEETTGPPKGFFYSYDYPVGIIVQKQGALKDTYQANKANFEAQLQKGASNDGSSQQGYHFS